MVHHNSDQVTVLNNYLQLNSDHYGQITIDRGIDRGWAGASCQSTDIAKATVMLGYPAKSPGIMLMSAEYGQWQFRPDIPWASRHGGLPPKYRTPKGEYDVFLASHPEIKSYWADLDALKARCFTINDKPYLLIAEGGFKSISGCSNGIPTVALVGVTMGLTPKSKGEPDLIPGLKRLAEAGFGFIIVFDADAVTNKNVRTAESKLTKALKAYNCGVLSVTGSWNIEDGKGMDDFIQKKGIEEFRAILMRSGNIIESPVTVDDGVPTKIKKPPSKRLTAAQLAEQYGYQWKYDDEQKTWRIYSGKHWGKVGIGQFTSLVKTTIDAKGVNYDGIAYIKDVVELLQCDLRQICWQMWDRKRYTNFSNCVLDSDKLTTSQHSPGMGFTSHLPYDYKPLEGDLSDALEALRVNCPSIHKFFRTAMQDNDRKMLKLLAIANGVLKHRFFDLQMFCHLVGAPGSGKGTFTRLMEKVVGRENFKGCQLGRLNDGSTKASVVDKQLVVFADERKPVGIDSILSFTGGDVVSYRDLYTPAADAFFYGCFLICSNKPIFVGDTTGLDRRLCLVHFDNPIPTEDRNHALENEFDAEIPALIGIALSLVDNTVTQAIRGIGAERIAEFKAKEWEMKVESSSTAAFFDTNLVLDPTATTRTGKLYDAYKTFCEDGGFSKVSIVKFPKILSDLLTDENLPFTRHQGAQAYFEGLRLRIDADNHLTHSQVKEGLGGGFEGLEKGLVAIPDIHLRELRDFATKFLKESESDDDCLPDEEERDRDLVEEEDLPPTTPSTPSNVYLEPDTSSSLTPSESLANSPRVPRNLSKQPRKFKIGDRVVVKDVGGIYQAVKGVVADIWYNRSGESYLVKFDKPVRNIQQREFEAFDLMKL
jgi:putative DNA primase/helicase